MVWARAKNQGSIRIVFLGAGFGTHAVRCQVDSTQDSWLQATLGRNGQVLQLAPCHILPHLATISNRATVAVSSELPVEF